MHSLKKQSLVLLVHALGTIATHRKSSFIALSIYLLAGGFIFSGLIYLGISHQDELKKLLLDYLFPESWHTVSTQLIAFFYDSQAKSVLVNMVLSGSLVVASVFLFPLKEWYSARFEKEQNYPNGNCNPLNLWMQGLEETRLFLFYLASQLAILWIGYYPYEWCNILSVFLSYIFLFYTFSLDLIAPTFQRHGIKYSTINQVLLKHPIYSLGFGLVYSLPAILIGRWITQMENISFIEMSSWLFAINLIFIALAVPAGTLIASTLLASARTQPNLGKSTKITAYLTLIITLSIGVLLHGRLIQSMHHKSQVLKVEYELSFEDIAVSWNALEDLSFGEIEFTLKINNSTPFDLNFENSTLRLMKNEQTFSTINFSGFNIQSGESKPIRMKIDSVSDFSMLGEFGQWLEGWRVTLEFDLYPGIPFIMELKKQED